MTGHSRKETGLFGRNYGEATSHNMQEMKNQGSWRNRNEVWEGGREREGGERERENSSNSHSYYFSHSSFSASPISAPFS